MLHGALAQYRVFSRESLNSLVLRFFSLRGFGTVTAALLCRHEQWDTLRSIEHAFFCHLSYMSVSVQLTYWQIITLGAY